MNSIREVSNKLVQPPQEHFEAYSIDIYNPTKDWSEDPDLGGLY